MRHTSTSLRLLGIAAALLAGSGCTTDTRFSQAQLDAIQMRHLAVPADRAYLGVIGALLEQRYQIGESDMAGGLLVATSVSGNEWEGIRRSTVQVAVLSTGSSSSSVRISTSTGGQTRVDEDEIARLHERVGVHVHTPATAIAWEPGR